MQYWKWIFLGLHIRINLDYLAYFLYNKNKQECKVTQHGVLSTVWAVAQQLHDKNRDKDLLDLSFSI